VPVCGFAVDESLQDSLFPTSDRFDEHTPKHRPGEPTRGAKTALCQ